MREPAGFQKRISRIEGLIASVESTADPALRSSVRELLESVMELNGAAFERALGILSKSEVSGAGLIEMLARDELIGSLLVLYDLHPDDFEARVRRGLEQARPVLRSHGAHLEAIEIGEGTVRVRIAGGDIPGLESAVRNALLSTAPDASGIVIEEQPAEKALRASGFVPLSSLKAARP